MMILLWLKPFEINPGPPTTCDPVAVCICLVYIGGATSSSHLYTHIHRSRSDAFLLLSVLTYLLTYLLTHALRFASVLTVSYQAHGL